MTKLRRRVGPLLAAVLLAAATSACEESTGPDPAAAFQGIWAGSAWRGDAGATLTGRGGVDSLHLTGSTPPGAGSMPAAYVRISVPARGTGEYALGPGNAAMTYLIGGDVASAVYATTRAGAGTLSITEYGNGRVAGSVTFDADAAAGERPAGAAARFEGSFRAPVRQEP
ncbi:MAG: hypothetical protein AB1941_28115 [Gemmatimonadota bacterium]